MPANSSSSSEPVVLFRTKKNNSVSVGALLGACEVHGVQGVRFIILNRSEPLPDTAFSERVLFVYSFTTLEKMAIKREIEALKILGAPNNARWTFIAGGPHPSLAPEETLDNGFDIAVIGEGENVFPKLVQDWLFNRINFGIYRSDKELVDINKFPGFHTSTGYLPPIEITRGCTYGCSFCAVPRLNRGVRHRSISSIATITESYLRLRPGRKRIKFLSPNAFAYGSPNGRTHNLSALKELLETLKEIGVPEIRLGSFPSEVRPEFVTEEILELVVPFLANRVIVVGAQTNSDERLQAMNRNHNAEDIIRAVRLLRKYRFTPHLDFIIGLPNETPEEQDQLMAFFEELVRAFSVRIHLHSFMALPGTPWYKLTPSKISDNARKRILAFTKAGVLDGWWENQMAHGSRKA